MVVFGQIVVGPPGSGKTTYCEAIAHLLRQLGRKVSLVNVDPANENVPYEADVDINDLIQLENVMEAFKLGPNGGLVYCMEYLEKNFDWLLAKLEPLKDTYLVIDCPGQVELYTHNNSVKNIVRRLEKGFGSRLCAVHLVDSHYCADPSKFLSVCLTSLTTMLQLELPHVNVLSKADLIERYGELDFNIDFYTDVLDLNYLLERGASDDPFAAKFKKLNEVIADLVTNFSLVHFVPCSVNSKEQMMGVRNAVDKANGYCFSTVEESQMLRTAAMSGVDFEYAKTREVREDFMNEQRSKEGEPAELLGNGLDDVDIQPGFQV